MGLVVLVGWEMVYLFVLPLHCCCCCCYPYYAGQCTRVYQPDAGNNFVMEAEDPPLTGQWFLRTGVRGYRGSGYIEWKPSSSFPGADPPGGGILSYVMNIRSPGRYSVKIRSAAPHFTEHNVRLFPLATAFATATAGHCHPVTVTVSVTLTCLHWSPLVGRLHAAHTG